MSLLADISVLRMLQLMWEEGLAAGLAGNPRSRSREERAGGMMEVGMVEVGMVEGGMLRGSERSVMVDRVFALDIPKD